MDRKHPERCKSIYNVSARFAYGPHRNTAASQGRESNWRPRAYSSAKPQPVSHRVGWARSKKPFCQQEWEEGESSLRHAIYCSYFRRNVHPTARKKKKKRPLLNSRFGAVAELAVHGKLRVHRQYILFKTTATCFTKVSSSTR